MINIIVTLTISPESTFFILTKKIESENDDEHHLGFLSFSEKTITKALQRLTALTGGASSCRKKYIKNGEVFYHVHYDSPNLILNSLIPSFAVKKRTKRAKMEYEFLNRNTIQLADNFNFLNELYEEIHNYLYTESLRLVKSNNLLLVRSDNWKSTSQESRGYAYVTTDSEDEEVGYKQFCLDKENKKNATNAPSSPLILKENIGSPTKRSPQGGRAYLPLSGMGLPCIYVPKTPTEQDSDAVKKASFYLQKHSSPNKSRLTNQVHVAEPERVEENFSNSLSKLMSMLEEEQTDKGVSNNEEANRQLLLESLKKEEAPLFYYQKKRLTVNNLKRVRKQKIANGNKRCIRERTIFGKTADEAAALCGMLSHQKFQWAHLIAHEFWGNGAQIKDNIVLTTDACNSVMMHLETVIRRLLHAGHTVELDVTAIADNETAIRTNYHCVSLIDYAITINGRQTHLKFNPLLALAPPTDLHIAMEYYVRRKLGLLPFIEQTKTSNMDVDLEQFLLNFDDLLQPSDGLIERERVEETILVNNTATFSVY